MKKIETVCNLGSFYGFGLFFLTFSFYYFQEELLKEHFLLTSSDLCQLFRELFLFSSVMSRKCVVI